MRFLILHIVLLVTAAGLTAQDMERLVDLTGQWRFEIGDDTTWAHPDFDDSKWDRIKVPAFWENQGYPGYDGWAWYRHHFKISSKHRYSSLYLHLGTIDDIDEVYINGRLLAFSGSAPPDYFTAFADARWYYIPYEYLNFSGENHIAVRVYDQDMGGGIIRGRVGIYRDENYLVPDQSLRGPWKLRLGDRRVWRTKEYDDSDWKQAFVPAYWETQRERHYDGYGWYRRHFRVDPALAREKLVLLLGRIDDVDEVYLNGERIGRTGKMPEEGGRFFDNNSYRVLRAYFIPKKLLRMKDENVISVRVFDGFMHGGMYEGPVGLIRHDRYRTWNTRQLKEDKGAFKRLIDAIFGSQ